MPGPVSVDHLGGDRFAIEVRGHRVVVDQPMEDGGEDSGPTPIELLLGSLAACVGFYARRFCRRHELSEAGLRVTADATMTSRPARLDSITVTLTLPEGFPDERREALLAVAHGCSVLNTLSTPAEVGIVLSETT